MRKTCHIPGAENPHCPHTHPWRRVWLGSLVPMRKLRLKELKWLAQGQAANKVWKQDSSQVPWSQGWSHSRNAANLLLVVWSLCVCAKSLSHVRLFATHGLQPSRLLCPWDSPGKNPGVGCHVLLQGIFLAQALNLRLLRDRWILYHWTT